MQFYRTLVALPSVAAVALGLFPTASIAQIVPDSSRENREVNRPIGIEPIQSIEQSDHHDESWHYLKSPSMGGNIQISTQGLFASPDSRITASSQFGVDGAIAINNPEVVEIYPSVAQLSPDFSFVHIDPIEGFEELKIEPIEPISRTFEECLVNPDAIFLITQRGGVAEDPTQILHDRTVWQDLRPLDDLEILEPTIDEAETVNSERSQREHRDAFDLQKCQALFDNQ
jgi:hypothetical protein